MGPLSEPLQDVVSGRWHSNMQPGAEHGLWTQNLVLLHRSFVTLGNVLNPLTLCETGTDHFLTVAHVWLP